MAELKPCRACGGYKLDIAHAHMGGLYCCLIGCKNIICDDEPVTCTASSKDEAERKARKKWNRRHTPSEYGAED